MKPFRGYIDELLANRPKDANGNPLCECGNQLEPGRFTCDPCAQAAKERENQRRIADMRARLLARAERGPRTAPAVDVARVGTPDFERLVKPKKFRAAAERWQPSSGNLVLIGPTGAGKTLSAIATLWRLKDEAISRCYAERSERPSDFISRAFWLHAYELVRARKEHPLGQGEAPEVERAMAATLLVLDDLGNEPADSVLFETIDHRYHRARPTIVTTGLAPAGIRERYGDALWRRLAERGTVLEARSA